MKIRSIIVNELTVTDPVRYKVYHDQLPATLELFEGQYVSRGARAGTETFPVHELSFLSFRAANGPQPGFTRRSSGRFWRYGIKPRHRVSISSKVSRATVLFQEKQT